MKQKFILSSLAIAFGVLSLSAQGEEQIVVNAGNAEHINIANDMDVVLLPGQHTDQSISLNAEATKNISLKLSDNSLSISPLKQISTKERVKVYLYVYNLKTIYVYSNSLVKTIGLLDTPKLQVFVYSDAKVHLKTTGRVKAKDTLEKISLTSSEMISEMNDIVWAINPRNDNMATILQRMQSFARPLLASQDVKFHFSYDLSVQHLHLDMTKRKNFYLIFKEAVNNAMKYSGCKNIWVDIRLHHHQLLISVKDDGKGFDIKKVKSMNTLSGNGVRNMEMRSKEMKGSCRIESDETGTTIILTFPIP